MITKNLIPITICFIIISLAIAITGCTSSPPTGPTSTPTPVPTYAPLTSIGKIAAGGNHGLAINNTGTALYAWGSNSRGQLGLGDKITFAFGAKQVSASILNNVTAIAAGNEHSLAVNGGTVYAWGENSNGQLGNNSNTRSYTPIQVNSFSIPAITAVAAGDRHSLALDINGTVWAWGSNNHGQLGIDSTVVDSKIPVQVNVLSNIIAIAANGDHCLALKDDHTVWAWGRNDYGQLGINSKIDSKIPVQVGTGFANIIAIAAGLNHSIALKDNGTVWTWGLNGNGQLGNGNTTEIDSPAQITTITNISLISAGMAHSLAYSSSGGGTTFVWGSNTKGHLGVSPIPNCNTPTSIAALSGAISAIAGGGGNCIVLKNDIDKTVWAWGSSATGNPQSPSSNTPVQVNYQTN